MIVIDDFKEIHLLRFCLLSGDSCKCVKHKNEQAWSQSNKTGLQPVSESVEQPLLGFRISEEKIGQQT